MEDFMQLKCRVCLFAFAAIVGAVSVTAQTPPNVIPALSTGNNGAGLNGIAATTSELLFTQPFCVVPSPPVPPQTQPPQTQQRGIYKEDLTTGTSTLLFSIPETGECAENYLAISPGLGGFTAGDTFATGDSTTSSFKNAVYKNGSTLFIDALSLSKNHVGITFDASGTFGFNMILSPQGGAVGADSTGAPKFAYPVDPNFILEGSTVAPLTYPSCPGCLFATAVQADNVNALPGGVGAIFFVTPGTPSATAMTFYSATPGPEPEGIVFIGNNNLSCTLAGARGAAYSYFVSGFDTGTEFFNTNFATTGAVLAYTPAQIAPFVGQFLVPDETGKIAAFSGPGASTVFSDTGFQLEGSTALQCPSGGCPATFGYWKHHTFPSSMFAGGLTSIGCMNYDAATLLAILNKNNGGGNAVTILGHQLIAAIANYDGGGNQTPEATAAIGSAIALLCANNINMSTAFVQSSTALGQQMTALAAILDTYNSSGSSCGEGSGLTAARATPQTNTIASLVRRPALTRVSVASQY